MAHPFILWIYLCDQTVDISLQYIPKQKDLSPGAGVNLWSSQIPTAILSLNHLMSPLLLRLWSLNGLLSSWGIGSSLFFATPFVSASFFTFSSAGPGPHGEGFFFSFTN